MLKQRIDQDLKQALLGGDKVLATTLRGLKSVILYAEVAKGVREQGLDDEEILRLLAKEAKKRQESADLFTHRSNFTLRLYSHDNPLLLINTIQDRIVNLTWF